MPTSILVDRLLLINALEKEQADSVTKFKADMEKFRTEKASYPERLLKALDDLRANVAKGKLPKGGRSYDTLKLPTSPEKPRRNGAACDLERMITTLKLSTQADVRIGEHSQYTQFICKVNGNGERRT